MIVIDVSPGDLAGLRFAYCPLMEVVMSYRVLSNQEFQGRYVDWVDEARHALYEIELPYLGAMITPHGYIPDFLTPPPAANRRSIHEEIAEVLATPDDLIRQGVLELVDWDGDSEMRRFFIAHPRDAVQCLADDLLLYWTRTIDHYWSRMISILETDILYRARILAVDGHPALFDDLHPSVSYQDRQLRIEPICMHATNPMHLALKGDGLQLVPSVFNGCGRSYLVHPDWDSMLNYTVRGTGIWYHRPAPTGHSLELALGAGRARVLESLTTPASTGELAWRLHISAGTASQHLARLTKAGLVEPRRSGKRVYYHLTTRGEKLIALFEVEP